MKSQPTNRCPRCHEGRLRVWYALNAEEQALASRLPASAEYTLAERQTAHRWCPKCWYEALEEEAQAA